MNGRVWATLSAVAVVAVGGATWLASNVRSNGLPPGILAASGRLEGRTIRVAAVVGGRIARLAVERGMEVVEGAVIAELDARSLAAAVSGLEAKVAAASAATVAAGERIAALQAQADLAAKEAARYERLYRRDAASRQTWEQAAARLISAEKELDAARASRELAHRQTDAARAELRAAEIQLQETSIRAPLSGHVTSVVARMGETVGPGRAVVTLLDADPITVRVYLPLPAAGRLRPGDTARVYVAAYPEDTFVGVVERVAADAQFTPKDVHMPDERTTLVFAVDIRVPNPDSRLKDGFPADVWLRTDPRAPWPDQPPW